MKSTTARSAHLGDALITLEGGIVTASNNRIRRVWCWTGKGFLTTSLSNPQTGWEWCRDDSAGLEADWELPVLVPLPDGILSAATLRESDDEGFTTTHLELCIDIAYEAVGLELKFVLWIWPDAPGMRTQLHIRSLESVLPAPPRHQGSDECRRVDYLPLASCPAQRRLIGYYADLQNRNDTDFDLLKETVHSAPLNGPEWYTWPSALCLEEGSEGVAMLKESHRCVNQRGHDAGWFMLDPGTGVHNTGWGLLPTELRNNGAWQSAWATWTFLWHGDGVARESAFKRMDRIRYPIDPKRDIYTQANTWGSTDTGDEAKAAAAEGPVLRDIKACADIGIDLLQIDDGWQGGTYDSWTPDPERYPDGFTRVREAAAKSGVGLGLWAAAMSIPLEDLISTREAGGFRQYKLDFANLGSHTAINSLMNKVRAFIKATGHQVRVNWDVTEITKRYGYWFAREYGSLYLANRKSHYPLSTAYRPHTVLRDLWQASRYLNLTRIQGPIQNPNHVPSYASDASEHSHAYCAAIALMSTPLFFQQVQFCSAEDRAELRSLLACYKKHRERIYDGITYPIGSCPDNRSWTGFQCHLADGSGYVLVFRELRNEKAEHLLPLRQGTGGTWEITDILTNSIQRIDMTDKRLLPCRIDCAPGFRFLHYTPV